LAALALPTLLPAATPAPEPAPAQSSTGLIEDRDLELDEVLVSGARRVRNPQVVVDWLKRLVGQFRYEGYVELHSDGAPQGRNSITGASDCVGFGPGPGVQCVMKVSWPEVHGAGGGEIPGGVSSLAPAMILYGLDPDRIGVRYMQLDNKGIAEGGLGLLNGETMSSTIPCADIPGDCKRTVRIEAQSDGKLIRMQIDIDRDSTRLVRYMFVMRKLQDLQLPRASGAPR
jgi:hypothetical protein